MQSNQYKMSVSEVQEKLMKILTEDLKIEADAPKEGVIIIPNGYGSYIFDFDDRHLDIWDTNIYTIRAASTMLPKVRDYINEFHIGNLTTLVLTPTDEYGRRLIWHRFTTLLRPELLEKDFITGFLASLHDARKRILDDLDEIEREHYT